jgi:hypothetical protein
VVQPELTVAFLHRIGFLTQLRRVSSVASLDAPLQTLSNHARDSARVSMVCLCSCCSLMLLLLLSFVLLFATLSPFRNLNLSL